MPDKSITEDNIKALVDAFYTRIRNDDALGAIFANAIGETDASWRPHLEKMYDFWSSVMLTSGRYHGNPLRKHKELPTFDISLFERWLELFSQTAQEIFTPEIAAIFISKSQLIARNLKFNLYHRQPSDFPIINAS